MRPTILYDGHCALCSRAVQVALQLDDEGIYQFAPLQSGFAADILGQAPQHIRQADSLVLADASGIYIKSDAFFRFMRTIGWPYRALTVLRVLPQGLRDGVYDWVARNRYRLFGQHESCWLPHPAWKERFLGE